MNELEIIQHPQIRGLHIFFNRMEYRTPHFHSEWEILCVMENDLHVFSGTQQFLMHPGDIVLIEPRQIHEYHCVGKACTFLCLQVSEELFPSLRGMHPESMFPRGIIPKDLYTRLKKQLLDIIRGYSQQEPQYELYCME